MIFYDEDVLLFTITFCRGRTSCYPDPDKNSTGGSYDWSDKERNRTSEAVKKYGSHQLSREI
jgi:hypothetical protein